MIELVYPKSFSEHSWSGVTSKITTFDMRFYTSIKQSYMLFKVSLRSHDFAKLISRGFV